MENDKIIGRMSSSDAQVRFTGSKLETPIIAPKIAVTTTPPAAILSKKFLREGVTPAPAASATSGSTMEAVSAVAASPAIAFSFKEARTWNLALLDFDAAIGLLEGLKGNALAKASVLLTLFWVALVIGIAIETAEVEAI